jgi:hypothetical protein
MRSKWIEYRSKKIFYQDFSNLFYNAAQVKQELEEVQVFVKAEPPQSALVLSDFRNTNIGRDLLPVMNAASAATKANVKRTAVLGVTGIKRTLADMLVQITGQPLKYFDDELTAKEWLIQD